MCEFSKVMWLLIIFSISVVTMLLSNLFPVQGFYVALRLVACAQSGQEVSLASLNLTVPPPKFVSIFMSNSQDC